MTLKRFCDVCKQEADDGYAFMNTSKGETIDMCKPCERAVKLVLAKRIKK